MLLKELQIFQMFNKIFRADETLLIANFKSFIIIILKMKDEMTN